MSADDESMGARGQDPLLSFLGSCLQKDASLRPHTSNLLEGGGALVHARAHAHVHVHVRVRMHRHVHRHMHMCAKTSTHTRAKTARMQATAHLHTQTCTHTIPYVIAHKLTKSSPAMS